LDIRLIDENRYDAQGLELLEAIKECRRKVRALVLTGYPTPEIETRAKEMGATETVFKSPSEGLNIVRFRRLVRELIRGSDS
jgi:ActR/RegA family two-component response regulator